MAENNSSLYNEDLAPVPMHKRTWNTWNYAALWISMSLCIPTYMLASSLIGGGMNWWQAILTIFLGNTVVLVPMILNGHAGAKYGIPFPVFARASFGVRGANIPAVLRAIVACGWFGIQAWIGGYALYLMTRLWIPSIDNLPQIFPASWTLQTGPALCFFLFWLLNMFVVYLGVESIRKLLVFKAFFLPVAALALLFWAINAGNGLGPILNQPSRFATNAAFWNFFFPALTGMVGFWATLSLNIPDFSRYAATQRDQVVGQLLGLPLTMALYSFIGVGVTSATTIIFGQTIWDPVDVLTRFKNPVVLVVAMLALCIATLATNIAANVVSPANDFSQLAPKKITFRIGGLITGIIGIVMMPWKLVADPSGYIFTWLIGYSALLGPIGGIMIADYFVVRRRRLDVRGLYEEQSEYRFTNGFSGVALIALILAVLPNLPGFLVTVKLINPDPVPAFFVSLYSYAWFVGFGIAFTVYIVLRKFTSRVR